MLISRDEWPVSLRWAYEFLPDYFTDAPAAFHIELMRDFETAEKRLIARIAPRGHAKSTCAALAYPLWCICTQRRRNIVIITQEASLARQFVRDIRQELESNETILAAYGDLCRGDGDTADQASATEEPTVDAPIGAAPISAAPISAASIRAASIRAAPVRKRCEKSPASAPPASSAEHPKRKAASSRAAGRPARRKWSEDFFITATGISVQAKSTGASFRGARVGPQRPDLIICDDIEKDEHIQSAESRRKLEYWLRKVVMPALAPEGRLIVVGSLIHYDSLLANLRDRRRFPRWDYRVYRALEAEEDEDGEYRKVALWPARWPIERLKEECERIGTLAFEQEYQAKPTDDKTRVFRPEWLQRYDPAELAAREDRLMTLMTVDPATGKEAGDYFAIWVGSVDLSTGIIHTRELILERINFVAQVKRVMAVYERWRPVRVGIEVTAYQDVLRQVLEEESRVRRLYMPVTPLRAVSSKKVRVEATAPFYENGMFRLPPVLDPEAEAQFLHFPMGAHDDAPDVCAMGIELARSFRTGPVEGVCRRDRNALASAGCW